ncbi:ribosomal protein uL16 3-hydroxylase [Pseudoduganella namucuonensis]|uniref:50S ribosomal protein L16 3-hydroxylase n=1 Tax=Pseudoduganella namucuonensis TaxID=1035707 RepID=A0A1I7ISY9_9BURK|nr:cupin domain-containing protein [Pseudoduganella namucuonensis]SFU76030.1 50S ribosomal protein L16 3-hydroxylase [Pseudoduganella namucuonensis]
MKKLPLLGDITPAQFLRDYWHKKPLLIRQAIPGFKPLLPFEKLAELAKQNYVESRLVTLTDGGWDMQYGPLAELPPRAQQAWTLLVQGVNLQDARADALLRQFRFVPDARLDDLMVSFATDGGGVGPHFDSYDVFLLQAQGQRRWRISAQKDLSLVEGLPLKILSNFEADEEFVLEPGDMLYLPPHYAHDGVAIGDCQTYSIGFRSPSYQELGENFLQFMADSIDLPGRYADPALEATAKPAEIPRHMLDTIAEELNKVRFTEDDITIFLGEYLSEPKHNVFFTGPAKPLTLERFLQSATKKGVALSRKTQMLYRGGHIFINGESFAIGRADRAALVALANQRMLDGAAVAGASDDVVDALYAWYTDGWLEFA